MSVPTNLIPTKITGLPEYTGTSQEGYLPYVLDGRTWKVQFSQVAATSDVPPTRAINTGVGLAGGGNLTQDRTIYIANEGVGYDQLDKTGVVAGTYGDALSVPTITVDDTGRVTGLVNTTIVLPQYVPTSRSILAGTGLTGGGDLTTNRTISINFSSATPQPLGAATAGTGTQAARDDHVHPAVDLSDTTETQGVLPLVRGGSGNALSPVAGAVVYSGSGGLYLTDPGTLGQVLTSGGPGGVPTWSTVSGAGTVTSVNVSGGTSGFTFTGGPITTAGTITMQDPDYIQFDTAATVTPATGRIWFDGGYTLNVGMNANVTGHAMEDNYIYVKASSAITKGQIVMFTGTVGSSGVPTGAPAAGLGVNDGLLIMGIAAETIALNGFGLIQSFGPLRGFNTTGSAYGETWADGDLLYYNSAYAGGLTNVQPVAPGIRTPIAAVLTAGSGGSGSILIRVTPGSVLGGTDSNVYINSLSNGDILQYNSANSRWQNVAPSFGSVTSVDASGGTTGLTFSGGPITSSGTLTLGGTLGVANGGTGATTLTANAILKGNGTSAVSASSITDDGTVVTIAEQVRLSSPNTSAAAWTTSGINLIQSAATFTDTTSTGTVADVRVNNFAAQTVAASNTITATTLYGTYFAAPLAGTNVTATARYALGADSATINGVFQAASGYLYLSAAGAFALTGSTGTVAHTFASATTASGQTKTISIGTNGASGSTTNITIGSATSGATSSITANGQVTLAPIGGSAAAWTTNGIALKQSSATWTDTSSTGNPGQITINNFAAQTIAATNVITPSYTYGTYFAAPLNGTNVTAGFRAAVGADTLHVVGTSFLAANADISSQTTTSQVRIAYGTTSSGNTKTVSIGTNGASGSTTAITIGSSTSGATSTTLLNGNVGVGSTNSTVNFANYKNITGGTTAYANYTGATIQSDVTVGGYGYQTFVGTAAAAFSLNALYHFRAAQATFGAGSSVNTQYGFYSSATNIDATANNAFFAEDTAAVTTGKIAYGFRSAINIATGGGTTYQMFMGGTAPSVVRGTVTFGGSNFSQAAWTTNGVGLIQAATTYTDTTSTGTVSNVYMNRFNAQTLAASNVVTVTTLFGSYFSAPAAGANVTVTTGYALGADSLYVAGNIYSNGLTCAGQLTLAGLGTTTTAAFATATTASGQTKTVNIGTGGASGSTTAITLGSSTSGATQTTTINGRVTLAPIGASAAAWTTSGIALTQSAATWTDTTSTGTVADVRVNQFNAQTVAASNTITATNLYGTYFTDPVAGTNVTATARYALGADSLRVSGQVAFLATTASISFDNQTSGTFTVGAANGTGTITIGRSTGTQTTNIQAGTTASGSTKTVNIGTGGASGSTTNITIGSSTSGATSTITLNGGVKTLSAATTSGATITPTADLTNQYNVTALATGATFAAPSGTPVDSQKLMLRIKDNGTGQTLAWNAIYRAIGTTLPTTTTANKTIYVGCVYNSADSKWDVVAVATEA